MTDITAVEGQPLDHVFMTSAVEHGDLDDVLDHHHNYQYDMNMVITTPEEDVHLYGNVGMHEGLTADGKVVIAVSVHDAGVLGVGEHPYEITVTDANNAIILSDSGKVTVEPSAGEPNQREEVRPWDLLDPKEPRAPKDIRDERMATCKGCDRFKLGICTECHCVMSWKTTLAHAECPIGKWGSVEA